MQGSRATFVQRRVESPWEFNRAEYWLITKRVLFYLNKDNVAVVAAGVAFFCLLSLFPMISAGLSIYGFFTDLDDIQRMASRMNLILPQEAWEIVNKQIGAVVSAPNSELSLRILMSLLIGLYAGGAGIRAVLRAMNVAYKETEARNPLIFFLLAFGMTLGLFAFVYICLILIVGLPVAFSLLGVDDSALGLTQIMPWVIMILFFSLCAGIVYRFGPDRRPPRKRWVLPGVLFTTSSWLLISWGFQSFVRTFDRYEATYGGLSAVILLLLWFWLTAMTVIVGAVINAEMERQTLYDTTRGPDRAIGLRKARVADYLSLGTRRHYPDRFKHAASEDEQNAPIDPAGPTLTELGEEIVRPIDAVLPKDGPASEDDVKPKDE